jgi:hypothetical protein
LSSPTHFACPSPLYFVKLQNPEKMIGMYRNARAEIRAGAIRM